MVTQLSQTHTFVEQQKTKALELLSNDDIKKLDVLFKNNELPEDFRRLAYTCRLYAKVCALMTDQFAIHNGGRVAANFRNRMIDKAQSEIVA